MTIDEGGFYFDYEIVSMKIPSLANQLNSNYHVFHMPDIMAGLSFERDKKQCIHLWNLYL